MKRSLLYSIIATASLAASAQSFTVYQKNGEQFGFNNSDVERIDFVTTNLPEVPVEPEVQIIDFRSNFLGIVPPEGVVDLVATPSGLGRISLTVKGVYMANSKCEEPITLCNSEGEVFSKGVEEDGVYVSRDVLTDRTELTIEVAAGGLTTPGAYWLSVPEGALQDTQGNLLGSTIRVFVIEKPVAPQTFVATPESGVVENIAAISLKFDNYPIVSLATGAKAEVVKVGTGVVQEITPAIGEDGTVTITLNPAIETPGTYTVHLVEGTFNLRAEPQGRIFSSNEIILNYQIEGVELAEPNVGDFYFSDGTWGPVLTDREGVEPIGVIFYLGEATEYGDRASYYTVKDGSEALPEFHGYVVALRDATDIDGQNEGVYWSFYDGWDDGAGCSSDTDDFLGYSNTKKIRERADKDYNGLSDDNKNFPATYYAAVRFEQDVPAPAQSSGWFLPSAGQMKYLWNRPYFSENAGEYTSIESALKQLANYGGKEMYVSDSEYWTSTEYYDSYGCSYRAYYFSFDYSNFNPGFCAWYNKNNGMRVRAVLAF